MDWTVALLSFALLLLVSVGGQPVILSTHETIYSKVGSFVSLECRAANLTDDDKLNWVFVKHSKTIYHGDLLMVDDPRYSLLHILASNSYFLRIHPAKIGDQGAYKCEIEGTKQVGTTELVLDDPEVPHNVNPPVTPLNKTDCCLQKDVAPACLPACYPSTAPDNVNFTAACVADLPSLIYCGTDGRNHENCCVRSGVPANCLMMCSNNERQLESLTNDELHCLGYTDQIISCYEFGGALLPSPPQNVSVVTVSRNGHFVLIVSWSPPEFNAAAVSGYIVHYKKFIDDKFKATQVLHDPSLSWSLPVEINTYYSFYLTAVGHHGASQPSNRIDIVAEDNSPPGHAKNVLACCQQRKVPSSCQDMLCHPVVWSTFNTGQMIDCFDYLPDVFSCLNGERNNTGCCQGNNVPELCLGMCSGTPPPFNKSLAVCVPKLPVMEACVQKGLSIQPAAPQALSLTDVTAHEAYFLWKAPNASSGAQIKSYLIQLRRGNENADWVNTALVIGTSSELFNLTESENYALRVISQADDKTSSLPSATLRFTTYPEAAPSERPTVIHNISRCCYDSGMPSVCAQGCQYAENMTSYYLPVINTCQNYIGTVLTCASDGRDHTPCCRQREVAEDCYDLCVYNSPGSLDLRYLSCLADTAKIVMCFKEGIEDLVRMPEDVVVGNLTSHTITLLWKSPQTGPKPDHYIVDYTNLISNKKGQGTALNSVYILQDLVPGSKYTVTVTSFRNDSYSPPTQNITLFTPALDSDLPFVPKPPSNTSRGLWSNRTNCCKTNNISSKCQPLCLNQPTSDAASCSAENHNILTCAADGRDHGPCCQANGLPEECLPFCSSHFSSNFSVRLAGCLADYSLNIITSCFLSNTGLLPSMPYDFLARKNYFRSVTLTWSSASNCYQGNCTYDVHYWRQDKTDPTDYHTIPNVMSPYNLTTLTPDVKYVFTVTAHNVHGSGPAAPWQTLYFGDLIPRVSIVQQPRRDVHEQGTSVKLTCDTYNFMEAPLYIWKLRDRVLDTKSRVLILTRLDETSEGNYSCTAYASGIRIKAESYVNVRFMPKLEHFRVDSARPNVGAEAVLACWYRGHPSISDVHNIWTKDDQPIPKTYHTSRSAKSRFHTGITAFRLKIKNVVRSDYGTYKCNVSNQYGRMVSQAKLLDPDRIPPPPRPEPKAEQDISKCCRMAGIFDNCLPLCTFEVSIAEAFQNPQKYAMCLFFFEDFVRCTADGADHTLCCVKEVVHKPCLPFCKGEVPSGNVSQCVQESPAILDCAAKGYEKIPTAPLNVQASFVDGKIKLAWEKPSRNYDRLTGYVIHYNTTQNPTPKTETFTSNHGLSYVIKNADNRHVYFVWMAAEASGIGRSQFTKIIAVSPYASKVPMPPTGVRVVTKGTTAFIKWSLPPENSPAAEAFHVYYKPVRADAYYRKITREPSIVLEQLQPEMHYKVVIASRNREGEGEKSIPVIFTTGVKGQPSAEKHTGDELSGGQVAGIVLAVFVTVAVLVVIAVFLMRSRMTKPSISETVSFENPGYGNQQQVHIDNLPGNNPYDSVMQPQVAEEKDGNFGYARLQEDHAAAAAEASGGATAASTSASDVDQPNTQYDNAVVEPKAVNLEVEGDGARAGPDGATKDESYT